MELPSVPTLPALNSPRGSVDTPPGTPRTGRRRGHSICLLQELKGSEDSTGNGSFDVEQGKSRIMDKFSQNETNGQPLAPTPPTEALRGEAADSPRRRRRGTHTGVVGEPAMPMLTDAQGRPLMAQKKQGPNEHQDLFARRSRATVHNNWADKRLSRREAGPNEGDDFDLDAMIASEQYLAYESVVAKSKNVGRGKYGAHAAAAAAQCRGEALSRTTVMPLKQLQAKRTPELQSGLDDSITKQIETLFTSQANFLSATKKQVTIKLGKEVTQAAAEAFKKHQEEKELDRNALIMTLRDVGYDFSFLPNAFQKRLFSSFDQDYENNKVDFHEFLEGLAAFVSPEPALRTEFNFKVFDLNDDGEITKKEMKTLLKTSFDAAKKLAQHHPELVLQEIVITDELANELVDMAFRRWSSSRKDSMDLRTAIEWGKSCPIISDWHVLFCNPPVYFRDLYQWLTQADDDALDFMIG